MKRPGLLVFLFGNPLVGLILAIAAIYFVYGWWRGQVSGGVAFVAVVAVSYAFNAHDRYEKYRLWKLEWNAMGGRAPARRASWLFRRGGLLHIAAGLFVWALCGYFIIAGSGQPGMQIPVTFFWLATFVMIVAGIYRLVRRRRPNKLITRDVPVTLCVSVPSQSPTLVQAFEALPKYCATVIVG